MNIFCIDIFDEYYNWEDYSIINTKHRFHGIYESSLKNEEFTNNLYTLIMNNKNDGLSIDTNQIYNIHFIKICLLLDEKADYNINYIEDYLSENYQKTDEKKIEFKSNTKHNVFLYGEYSKHFINDKFKVSSIFLLYLFFYHL